MVFRDLISDGTRSVPCLLVNDVSEAARFYGQRFGFDRADIVGDPPIAAMVRRGDCAILLQAVQPGLDLAPGEMSRRRHAGQAWDAFIEVDNLDPIAKDLRARGTQIQVGIGITFLSDRTLEVRDDWGNVIAFAERPVSTRASMRRLIRSAVPNRMRHEVAQWRRDREEQVHLREIKTFCAGLDRPDPFYMFFTEGLLHWVAQAARLVPPEVNLVLIGSKLSEEEVRWLAEHVKRPLHNIRLGVDDNTTWEFLFAANNSNFGYLDIDCFVLAPELFEQMTQINPEVAVNAIWTYDTDDGKPIACTHFAFINLQVARALQARGTYMTPANYDWIGSNLALLHPRTWCRIPTSRQRQMLLRVLPPDDHGRPIPPGESQFFDTLVAYQLAAYANGYSTNRVRNLAHRTQRSLLESAGGPRVWQQDMSAELVHVGGVSYYRRFFHQPELRAMYVAAEYAMLQRLDGLLPDRYRGRAERLRAELAHYGLSADSAPDLLYRHLVDDRGLPPAAAARILDMAVT
ncbi:hypothetical protein Rhe02_14850 [Rhizocola hellebori]|uniref:VOC domain-containing protein n=1 Tax=Rhizocola hellebori TaxID=1392758 RepID=A0A8J3VEX8_9ACTN|nr:VOC family protein [Rhizocola hellebori]GIH03418.1 hypothetical protein Rhe02_14850 [Rhizocola hellebori]